MGVVFDLMPKFVCERAHASSSEAVCPSPYLNHDSLVTPVRRT